MKLYGFTSGSDWAPVGYYLIRHPKGNVVVDTGARDRAIVNRDAWWGPLARAFSLPMLDEAMHEDLERIGLRAADIRYVVLGDVRFNYDRIVQKYRKASFVGARNVDLFDDRRVVLRDRRLANADTTGIFHAHVPTIVTATRQAPDYYE